ncbi:MAG: DUF4872 domain-containing protein, partial [Solirubrobacterales bacterium]
ELQTTGLENLAMARHEKLPVFTLDGHMFTIAAGSEIGDLRAAAPQAISYCAERMLEPPLGDYEGLPALRRFADEVGGWPETTEDSRWCARFNYQVIERRGTGGGNFRMMYARFLEEVGRAESALAVEASARWTELAGALHAASGPEESDGALWAAAGAAAAPVLEAEERLWTDLAGG